MGCRCFLLPGSPAWILIWLPSAWTQRVSHTARGDLRIFLLTFFFPPLVLDPVSELPVLAEAGLKHTRTPARPHARTQGWRFARMLAEEHFGTIESPPGSQSAFTLTSRLHAEERVYHKKWKILHVKRRRHPGDVRLNPWFFSSASIDTSGESCFFPPSPGPPRQLCHQQPAWCCCCLIFFKLFFYFFFTTGYRLPLHLAGDSAGR